MRRTCWILVACAAIAGCGSPSEPSGGSGGDVAGSDGAASSAAARAPAAIDVPEYDSKSLKNYDVVLVVIDGLRADRVNANTTPFLSEFAAQGFSFTNTASNSSFLLQSLASMYTGRLPTAGGTIGVYEAEPQDATRTVAQYFQGAGYYTGLLANHPAIVGAGFTKGFEEIDIARADQPLDDARLVKRAAEFWEDAGEDRVFLYVHFAGPLASGLYQGDAAPGADTPLNIAKFAAEYATAFPPTQGQIDATAAEYDAAIRAADARLAELVAAAEDAGRAEKTLFAVTSLHGFELLEHGMLGSGWTVFDESLRVPLVLHAPGALPEAAIEVPVSLVDVLPTLIAMTGLEDDGAACEGKPLFEARGETLRFVHDGRPRIAEVVIPERCIVRSVTEGAYKYIAASLWPEPGARFGVAQAHKDTANAYLDGSTPLPPMWGAGAYEAVFDLAADPGESRNLAGAPPDRIAALTAALESYRARCSETGIAPRMATQFEKAPDAEQLQNLESLGYL